jgi:5,5'-dehydrodivanillate O-demethylase
VAANPRPGNEDDMAWRVPIDDVTHRSFGIRWVNRTGADAEEYLARRQEQQQREPDTSWEVAAQVLAGQRSMHTLPLERTDLTSIEDDITQVGQGVLPDRSQEHLGATDAPIILSRRIWLREMQALAEGRPLKQWQTPPFPQG